MGWTLFLMACGVIGGAVGGAIATHEYLRHQGRLKED